MPIYTFSCQECDEIWENQFLIEDRGIPLDEPCPYCNTKDKIQRNITPVSIAHTLTVLSGKKMDSEVKNRIDKIRNTPGASKETTQLQF